MAKNNLFSNFVGQFWVALMSLAFIPLYVKYLGVESYGVIGLYVMLQSWLTILDMGMGPTLGREMSCFLAGTRSNKSIRDLLRSIEFIVLFLAISVSCLIALSSSWIGNLWVKNELLSNSEISNSIILMGIVCGFRFIESIYRSAVLGLQDHYKLNLSISISASLRAFGAIFVLHYISSSINAFFIWQGVVSMISLLSLMILTYNKIPKNNQSGRFSLIELKSIWRFSVGMFGISSLALILTQIDKLMLSHYLSLSDFGYYSIVTTVAGSLFMLVTPITTTYYPRACFLFSNDNEFELARDFHRSSQLITILVGSISLVMIMYSESLLDIWTGNVVFAKKSSLLLSIYLFGTLLNAFMWVPLQTQLACGWTRLSIYVNIFAILFIVPSIYFGVKYFGAEGAALSWVVLNIFYLIIIPQFMFSRILKSEKSSWYKSDIFIPLFGMFFIVLFWKLFFAGPYSVFTQLVIMTLSFATAFLVGCLLCPIYRNMIIAKLRLVANISNIE
jgi:O-antigen/teichoic acid export membrane protein